MYTVMTLVTTKHKSTEHVILWLGARNVNGSHGESIYITEEVIEMKLLIKRDVEEEICAFLEDGNRNETLQPWKSRKIDYHSFARSYVCLFVCLFVCSFIRYDEHLHWWLTLLAVTKMLFSVKKKRVVLVMVVNTNRNDADCGNQTVFLPV